MAAKANSFAGAAAVVLILLSAAGCAGHPATGANAPAVVPPPAAAAAPAGQPESADAAALSAALDQLAEERDADISVAVLDNGTGESWSYNPEARYLEASLVKVPILLTLVREASEEQRSFTEEEEALAVQMIEYSDNDATTALYGMLGGRPELNRTYELIGVRDTEAGETWGATETSVEDQLRIIRTAACGADWLDPDLLAFAVSLMENVCPEQSWGVSAGTDEAQVALKNGWLQDDDAVWNVGSAGIVRGWDKDYSIVVLSSRNSTLDAGIDVVEGAASVINGYRR
ncbi:class A beta-lactamase-related serine hydrolase [Arthrobacter sp. zg-Y40]|uniref:serine hydrolase n=1 Tax=unclassified Arthrobacter TaxID=235627 RepID=UPI001D13EB0F|nr:MULTISPECIES: serine hydrolase [unclassified Arthrobacter]MCC3275052.1 class A beta-lactamase-related serine hydrolase [Arthrobacter sp. zg-Y20]MCC3278976.1 class A beta-lactamase-related serine hydrolase [Arthrobacter sp. zg-Y40]MDK1315209.1 serine hydrolase [Arthrobacter sp. zg.Y20]MDK1328070.1 serine hydrolase [Arthrobacter sp. zg-Y1143]WIB05046.1 serine hydrolase [Arthrobacter sp. zg-Y20]